MTKLLFFALALLLCAQAQANQPIHILIDPGHGGSDDGAIRGKVREATIALKVSQKLAGYLKNDPRFDVSMTRETDEAVPLPERTKIAALENVDLYLSVHANASSDPR